MPSTTLADYQVIADAPFTLDAATNVDTKTLKFTVPDDLEMGDKGRKPLIAFKVLPIADTRFSILMNQRQIADLDLSQSTTRGYWEVFSFGDVFPDGSSHGEQVDVKFQVSTGKVRLDNVVVWYQVRT